MSERKMARCNNCGEFILREHKEPVMYGDEWGYRMGRNMYFCSYACKRLREHDINEKRTAKAVMKQVEKGTPKMTNIDALEFTLEEEQEIQDKAAEIIREKLEAAVADEKSRSSGKYRNVRR